MVKPNIHTSRLQGLNSTIRPKPRVIPPIAENDGDEEHLKELLLSESDIQYAFDEVTPERYHSVTEEELAEAKGKLVVLKKQITEKRKEFVKDRKNSRNWAFFFRILTTLLASVVTILLGINFEGFHKVMNNIALIISVGITVLSIIHRFFDSKELWVQYTHVAGKLEGLLFTIEYLEESQSALRLRQVEYIKYQYDKIMSQSLKFVVSVRNDD